MLQALRTTPANRDLPVVVVSVLAEQRFAATLGATDYLVKPVDRDCLLGALRRLGVDPAAGMAAGGRRATTSTAPAAEEVRAAGAPVVLLIEDDPHIVEVVRRSLEVAGGCVVATTGGAEAQRLARELRPGTVLLDVLLEADRDG